MRKRKIKMRMKMMNMRMDLKKMTHIKEQKSMCSI
jgi:hypothetical protein